MLAAPVVAAGVQGHQNAGGAVHGAAVIGDQVEGDGGGSVGFADQVQHAAHGEVGEVRARQVAVWAGLAVAAERAIDEAGIDAAEGRVIGVEPLHGAGLEALYQHVGAAGQLVQNPLAGGAAQVQSQALLAAVQIGAGGRPAPLTRLRRFDLQHLGAHAGQHHGAEAAGGRPGDFKNRYALQRVRHRSGF